jgi:hypothetical protein
MLSFTVIGFKVLSSEKWYYYNTSKCFFDGSEKARKSASPLLNCTGILLFGNVFFAGLHVRVLFDPLMIIKKESILFAWAEFVNRSQMKIGRDLGKKSRLPGEHTDDENRSFENGLCRQGSDNEIHSAKENRRQNDPDG